MLLLHAYVIVPVAPVTLAVAVPSEPPRQLTLSVANAMVIVPAEVIIVEAVSVHPLASVAVTVYVSAVSPVIVAVVAALLQTNVMVPVPPLAEAAADPVPPLHVG